MGAWGVKIFDDDLAADVRLDFREMIGDGLSPEAATRELIKQWSGSLDNDDEAPTFWIALAATQWQCGRLLDRVKAKALKAIDSGSDLRRWDESEAQERTGRRRALEKLRAQLLSPQPKPSRIRKAYHDRTDWEIGHLVSYRLKSGRLVVFRAIGIDSSNKDRIAIVDLCDWVGTDPPAVRTLVKMTRRRTLAFKPGSHPWDDVHDGKFCLYSMGPRDFPADRVAVLATGQPVVGVSDTVGAMYFGGWAKLDDFLDSQFGMR